MLETSSRLRLSAKTSLVLEELASLGKAGTAKMYARHGVTEPSVGLSAADLARLVKRLGVQHDLAVELWKSGMHDARVLATKIADPATMAARELEAWMSEASNYVITDALAELAARLPGARSLALRWIQSQDEWRSAAGWNVVASLALAGGLDDTIALTLLQRIEKNMAGAYNRTRHSMNGALIAIGGSHVEVRGRALEVAEKIGKVEVDHGQTSCKTPEAAPYIRKMVEHAGRRQAPAKASAVAAPAAARRTSRRPKG